MWSKGVWITLIVFFSKDIDMLLRSRLFLCKSLLRAWESCQGFNEWYRVRGYKQSWARDNCLASRQRQHDNVIEPQGPEKNRKIIRPQCLDGVVTINKVKWQLQTTLWPDNMVTLSRQNCRVPSSGHPITIHY